MERLSTVSLAIVDDHLRAQGCLSISLLPNAKRNNSPPLLSDVRGKQSVDDDMERVRLVEGTEYLYEVRLDNAEGPLETDQSEMFFPDSERGNRGRLRTGLYTGSVRVGIIQAGREIGWTSFEVQSTKLEYATDYRWMLRDIAEVCADLIMDRFTPSMTRFAVDDARNSGTLYQRFSFLRGLLERSEFQAAIGHILTAPYVTWNEEEHLASPIRGLRPSSRAVRMLARPGPRVRLPNAYLSNRVESVPRSLMMSRMETSVDNLPNRFVKWVLEEWRAVVMRVAAALESTDGESAFMRRGKREVAAVAGQIDAILSNDLFQDIGEMKYFPAGSQVLQKREGYRYLAAAYVQFEAAARLSWPGMEDIYSSGQRNVAKLYEYWVYMQLGRIIAGLCNSSFDSRQLVEPSNDGLVLRLRSSEHSLVLGKVQRLGRTIELELWFNRTFSNSGDSRDGSWTRPLRPDCSLLAKINSGSRHSISVWLHFDAKYRLRALTDIVGDESIQTDTAAFKPNWRRDDLLKMHAYKDAIRHSAGAYIVYPGHDGGRPFRQYHELLPGLGAFALRPTKVGETLGAQALIMFIEHVLTHLALQASQHERARFWMDRAYSRGPLSGMIPAAAFLDRPPADVVVLLGYAKSTAHRSWITRESMYNLRADPQRAGTVSIDAHALAARLIVVYTDDDSIDIYKIIGSPRVMTAEQLECTGYPNPGGLHYICLLLERIQDDQVPPWLNHRVIELVCGSTEPPAVKGAPVTTTWLDLCAHAQSHEVRS